MTDQFMNIENLSRRLIYMVFALGLMLALAGMAQAQINVTDYGAKGDLLTLDNVSVVNNSTTVVSASANFVGTDVGKIIEVFDAGTYHSDTTSNETLIATITAVNSPTSITVSSAAGLTADGLSGYYGNNNIAAFNSAIADCPVPTATIVIPQGNYLFVPSSQITAVGNVRSSLYLHRGGITFAGQGTAILTGNGGWRSIPGQNPVSARGALFKMSAPMTNDYPLVFSNLVLDGGVKVGNIKNLGYPGPGNGWGWDGTHHWMVTVGGGALVDSIVMLNCTVQHWRGEMMEDTSGQPNVFLSATNCLFTDGNGSCINNFAHSVDSCTFSNANQAEEFYRTYVTNASVMANSLFVNLGLGSALNGGNYDSPPYTIIGNTFTNAYSGINGALATTPACNVYFISNTVSVIRPILLGIPGYQGTTINSNIVVAFNTFIGGNDIVEILGDKTSGTINISDTVNIFSNTCYNVLALGSGGGWSTNVTFQNNIAINSGPPDSSRLQGQYFLDVSNRYVIHNYEGNTSGKTNKITYVYGSQAQIGTGNLLNGYYLDDTVPAKMPADASLTVTNSSQLLPYTVFTAANLSGKMQIIDPGQAQTFYWNKVKGGYTWMTNKIYPPLNLRTNL
jgi:hypothetical protein